MSERKLDLPGAPAGTLLRRNRPERPTQPVSDASAPSAEQKAALVAVPDIEPQKPANAASPAIESTAPRATATPTATKPRTARSTTTRAAVNADVKEATERVGGYIPATLRARAVAAHQATQYMEGESNWTDFITAAIVNETERREKQYNEGQPFELRSGGKLKTGRPLRS